MIYRAGRLNENNKAKIKAWIQKHWIEYPQLKRYSPAANNFKGGFLGFGKRDPYGQYSELRDRLANVKKEHTAYVEGIIDKLTTTSAGFEQVLTELTDIKQANLFDYNSFINDINSMMQIIASVKSISKRDTPAMVKYKAIVREIKALNQMYVDFDAVAVEAMLNSVILETFDFSNIKMHPNELANIDSLLNEYRETKAQITMLENDINCLPDKYLLSYWNGRSEQLIIRIWSEHRSLIPEALLSTISEGMVGLKDKQIEMKRCCEIREKIYTEYDKTYKREYEESKI